MYQIKIIGIGAAGSHLGPNIAQYLNYHGKNSIVTLIDGDSFDDENRENQRFQTLGNKASVKKDELRAIFSNVRFRSIEEFVDDSNAAEIIENGDIVFVCVDNGITMARINNYCRTLDNVVLISGGVAEKTDGDMCIYIRKDGQDITPDLTYGHDEMINPTDKAPHEMDCGEAMKRDRVRLTPILTLVNLMMITFMNYIEGTLDYYEIYFDTKLCKFRKELIPKNFNKHQ